MSKLEMLFCIVGFTLLAAGCPPPTPTPSGVKTTIPNVRGEFRLYPTDPAKHVEPMVLNDERYGKPSLVLLSGWAGEIKPEEYLTYKADTRITGAGGFDSEISDADLKLLGALGELKQARFYGCIKITDAGLKELAGLAKLEYLDLSHCHEITDTGLRELKKLGALQKLELHYCRKLTEAGIDDLRKSLPKATITRMLDE